MGEWHERADTRRRVTALVVVFLLVLLASGVGTLISTVGPGDRPATVATTAAPEATSTGTPTPDGGGVGAPTHGSPAETDTPGGDVTATGTPSEGVTPSTPSEPNGSPTPTPTEGADGGGNSGGVGGGPGGGGEAGSTATPSDRLVVTADGPLLDDEDVLPGAAGIGRRTVESNTSEDGEVWITELTVEDREEGVTEPESKVDDSTEDGELPENLEVRIVLEHEDGYVNYVLGTEDGFERLVDLQDRAPSAATPLLSGDRTDVTVYWRLPAEAGNEVQSDEVDLDLDLEWRSS